MEEGQRKTSQKEKRLASAKRLVAKRLPVIQWLSEYNAEKLVADMIAGITVGLTVMPQGLAYAALGGLQPQYGLYSAFMGCFVYAIFGSIRDITIGPTALMSLMTYQQVIGRNADFAVLLCFLSGCVQIVMSVLRLGVLIDFISIPVTVGFTSATSVIIAVSQLKGLLGLKFTSSGFIDTVQNVASHIHETRLNDTLLGSVCIIILLLLRKAKDFPVIRKDVKPTKKQRVVKKAIWLISTARNALVVVFCSLICYWVYDSNGEPTFLLTGDVKSGLPEFKPPPFNTTIGETAYSFTDMCNMMGSAIVLVPVIAVLGNVAIAKAFASGDSIDATQELLTLGLCNLLGSFASSMPITGSFSRSAVNHASGVRTPLGGVYTGIIILLALYTLTPYFFFIPKAALSAVIICAVIFMIEYEVVKPMWKSSKKDLIPTIATFVLCLLIGVEYGILVGVAINLVILLYPSARPSLRIEKASTASGAEYLMVTPSNSLYFPAVDFIRSSVVRAAVKQGCSSLPVILDCRHMLGADFTAAKGIAALIDDFNKRKQAIYFFQPCAAVVTVFKGAVVDEFIHVCSLEELDYLLSTSDNSKKARNGEMCNLKIEELTSEPSQLTNLL